MCPPYHSITIVGADNARTRVAAIAQEQHVLLDELVMRLRLVVHALVVIVAETNLYILNRPAQAADELRGEKVRVHI